MSRKSVLCHYGIASLELALAIPVLMLAFAMTVDLGQALILTSDLTGPCYEAVRFAGGSNGLADGQPQHESIYDMETGVRTGVNGSVPSAAHEDVHNKTEQLLSGQTNLRNSLNPRIRITSRVIPGVTPADIALVEVELSTQYRPIVAHFIPGLSGTMRSLRLSKRFQAPYRL